MVLVKYDYFNPLTDSVREEIKTMDKFVKSDILIDIYLLREEDVKNVITVRRFGLVNPFREITMFTNPLYQGNGYCSKAVDMVLKELLNDPSVKKIVIIPGSEQSVHIAEKYGFVCNGGYFELFNSNYNIKYDTLNEMIKDMSISEEDIIKFAKYNELDDKILMKWLCSRRVHIEINRTVNAIESGVGSGKITKSYS